MIFKTKLMIVLLFMMMFTGQSLSANDNFSTEEFSFNSAGMKLNGIISRPINNDATSIAIIVHGYGSTNVVAGNWYYSLRKRFTDMGIAVLVWDKPGNGKSEGEFDINQPVDSSADEIVAAIKELKQNAEPGSSQIGLIGGSRAGWISPLAINKQPDIKFWISISGTDGYESWGYLLRSNLELEDYSATDIKQIHQEWIDGNRIFNAGGSYEDYLIGTIMFRKNPLVQKLTGREYVAHTPGSEAYELAKQAYLDAQKEFMAEGHKFDPDTGLEIVIKDFDKVLNKVSIPVLALFGSNDRHVDWRKTKALYEKTLGKRAPSLLTVKVFEGADHSLKMSKTGGYFESHNQQYWQLPYAEGYYETISEWLCNNNFCAR